MIYFVIGPPCSGKTEFIRTTFPGAVVIDLKNYQGNLYAIDEDTVKDSYLKAKAALEYAVRKYPERQIVLEHTLLKKKRRKMYIDAVRKYTDKPISCYVMQPDKDTYREFCRKRKIDPGMTGASLFEMPEKEEGFDNVFVIRPEI